MGIARKTELNMVLDITKRSLVIVIYSVCDHASELNVALTGLQRFKATSISTINNDKTHALGISPF